MKLNTYKLKREILPFAIAYILFDIIVIGALSLAIHNAPEAENSFERLMNIFNGLIPNITGFKFFEGIFVNFSGFMTMSFWCLIVFAILFIYWKIKNQKTSEYEGIEQGSSDWSKGGEEFDKLPNGSEILNRKSGFILSKNHYLGTDLKKVAINKNILVIGGSGAGKSACYIKPNILQMLGSYVITDPKGELYRDTSGFLKANGYEVKVFNLVNPEYSDCYNPILHIEDHADVDKVAELLVVGAKRNAGGSDDPFWDNTAKMLLKACIYYVISVLPPEEQNISSCLNIIRQGGADDEVFKKLFIDELKPEHPGRKEYENFSTSADKTKQSIVISAISKINIFDTPAMQKITTSNSFTFEDLGDKKLAIYVITSTTDSTYDFVSTIFFTQMFQKIFSYADKNGGTLNNQVYFLLDEFANIGQIPDFQKKLSVTRQLGISISIVIQALDQLEALYKEDYETIIGNCDTQLFLGSQSIKTCEYISKSLGQKTIRYKSKSISKDSKEREKQGVSISEQIQGRELMTVDELKRLPNDDEILIIRSLKPIRAKKAWYFKYHPMREVADRYKIHNVSEMPKTKDVPIHIMDVQAHLKERERKANEYLNKIRSDNSNLQVEIPDGNGNVVQNNSNDEQNQTMDLQRELEKKFDELFGTSNH